MIYEIVYHNLNCRRCNTPIVVRFRHTKYCEACREVVRKEKAKITKATFSKIYREKVSAYNRVYYLKLKKNQERWERKQRSARKYYQIKKIAETVNQPSPLVKEIVNKWLSFKYRGGNKNDS